MTDTTKKRRHLTDRETALAYTLMNENLQQALTDGPDAMFVYVNGWSDQRIADEVGCTLNNVVGLRERNFGKLTKAPEPIHDPRVSHLIAAHNEFVRDVCLALQSKGVTDIVSGPYLVETK